MMNIVQSTNLGKECCKWLVIAAPVVDGTCPVVSPLNHGARFQAVAPYLIQVVPFPCLNGWPVAKCQQIL